MMPISQLDGGHVVYALMLKKGHYVARSFLLFAISYIIITHSILWVLMIVLGVQMIAVGLIGELIIFTHAKEMKEYVVEQSVEFEPADEDVPVRVASDD